MQADCHRGAVLVPHNTEGGILHVDDHIGIDDLYIRKVKPIGGGNLFYRLAVSDHHDGHTEFIARHDRAAHQFARGVVTAHHINDNFHVHTPHFSFKDREKASIAASERTASASFLTFLPPFTRVSSGGTMPKFAFIGTNAPVPPVLT